MSISGLLNATYKQPETVENPFSQRRAALRQLGEDLQSGNFDAAKQDYVTLTSVNNKTPQSTALDSVSIATRGNPLVQVLQTIKQALDNADEEAAKQAYAELQKRLAERHKQQLEVVAGKTADADNIQTSTAARNAGAEQPKSSGSTATSGTSNALPVPPEKHIAQAFQELGRSVQSGDLTGAIKAMGKLWDAISQSATPNPNVTGKPMWVSRGDVVSVAYLLGSDSGSSSVGRIEKTVA